LSLAEVGLVAYLWLVTVVTCLQTVSADNKVRLASLTAAEKEFLAELMLDYQAVIENKKSDEVNCVSQLCPK